MAIGGDQRHARIKAQMRACLAGPQLLAFMPAITLGTFWIGGEAALILMALLMPAFFALAGLYTIPEANDPLLNDPITSLPLRLPVLTRANEVLRVSQGREAVTAGIAVAVDEFSGLVDRMGDAAGGTILRTCRDRLVDLSNDRDLPVGNAIVGRLDGPRFILVLTMKSPADLETLIQLSTRLQKSIQEPVRIGGTNHHISVSVGFCTPKRNPGTGVESLVTAAEQALDDAVATGTGVIRAFTNDMQRRARTRGALAEDLPAALEGDQIVPWFQPQIEISSQKITGFEVLARWEHPETGLVPPGEFLPAVEELGLLERLGEVMLFKSLEAMRKWDAENLEVPNLSLNFSAEELRNPTIVERMRWELDRFEVPPERITVEVLETVIAQSANDTIIRNLRALSEFGFGIDLDDFGTGHASIANIKRFSVGRIKIDRSFISGIESDQEQQNIVSAILTLAERLELKTLAEGVETEQELGVLRQLGCTFVQGFAIARPMPFDHVLPWVSGHHGRIGGPEIAPNGKDTSRTAISGGKTA